MKKMTLNHIQSHNIKGRISRLTLPAWALGGVALLAIAGCGESTSSKDSMAPTDAAAASDPSVIQSANEQFLAMADRHAVLILEMYPLSATQLGVTADIAGIGFQSKLGDYSPLARDEVLALNDRLYRDLREIDPNTLSGTAAITFKILDNAYKTAAHRNQFGFGRGTAMGSTSPYLINQLLGPHIELPRLLLTQHPLQTAADATAYVVRLEAMAMALRDTEDALRLDAEAGIVPPSFALLGAAGSIDSLTAVRPDTHILLTYLSEKMALIESLDPDAQAALSARANAAMRNEIYPAYADLAAALRSMVEASGAHAGVWRLDRGEAFYQHALNSFGANDMSAEEIHQLGLGEVARISAQMNVLFNQIGTPQADTAGLRFALLAQDPAMIYPNTDASREELLEALRGQVSTIMALAPQWFGTIPPQGVDVRRIPIYEQDTAPGGYYSGPSLDGTRPGSYWINLKDTADWPKYTLKTLTYHEAVPGHHFQIALQQAVEDMPLIRNMIFYSEYGEGWALYAESVAAEMGMYKDDPLGDIGRLQSELFRAARLVVDTGLHHKRWTREEAIDWMVAATGDTRPAITREIERYSIWPGQATSYKLGMLKIAELRARAENTLGDRFDIRTFHDEILLEGSMPLPILEEKIDAWIAQQNS